MFLSDTWKCKKLFRSAYNRKNVIKLPDYLDVPAPAAEAAPAEGERDERAVFWDAPLAVVYTLPADVERKLGILFVIQFRAGSEIKGKSETGV